MPAEPSPPGRGERPAARPSWRTKPPFCFCLGEGRLPAGAQQGLRTTARAVPSEQLPPWSPAPGQGGGSGPPGKPSTRAPCGRRKVRGSWEPALEALVPLPLSYPVCLPPLGLSLPSWKGACSLMIPKGESAVTLFLRGPEPLLGGRTAPQGLAVQPFRVRQQMLPEEGGWAERRRRGTWLSTPSLTSHHSHSGSSPSPRFTEEETETQKGAVICSGSQGGLQGPKQSILVWPVGIMVPLLGLTLRGGDACRALARCQHVGAHVSGAWTIRPPSLHGLRLRPLSPLHPPPLPRAVSGTSRQGRG